MMGHSTAFITERYMHVADEIKAAAKALSGPERMVGSNEALTDKGRVTEKFASYTLTSTAAKT